MSARLEATENLESLIKKYYNDLYGAEKEGIPTAWLNVGVPCQIFYAMDMFPFYPENYAAAAGSMKLTPQLSAVAEARGFSADLCSYVRTALGTVIAGEGAYGPLPRPTVQVSAMNSCIMIMIWWRAVEREWDVPTFVVDTPLVEKESTGINLDYVNSEVRTMVALRGTPEFVEHLRLLRDEVKDRVERGFAAVPEERYRLLWDNLPPWYD